MLLFLQDCFPRYDVYVWINSDVWLQDAAVLECYVAGEIVFGIAATHAEERGFRFQPWLFGWAAEQMLLGCGSAPAARLLRRPPVNAGFFAVRAGAPHWCVGAGRYAAALDGPGI